VVLWEPHLLPTVVLIGPAPPDFAGARAVPPESLPDTIARSEDGAGQSMLLDDAHGPHRLRIAGDASATGWAFVIPDDAGREMRLHALHRLLLKLASLPTGILSPEPALSPYRRYRLALAIRALDGEAEGASRREIGIVLFSPEARDIASHDWKSSGLRKKVARLMRLGHAMRDGDYRHLLTRAFDRIRWR
jgi:hypothetical protein